MNVILYVYNIHQDTKSVRLIKDDDNDDDEINDDGDDENNDDDDDDEDDDNDNRSVIHCIIITDVIIKVTK